MKILRSLWPLGVWGVLLAVSNSPAHAQRTYVRSVDFQNWTAGSYTTSRRDSDWGATDWQSGVPTRTTVERFSNGSQVLKLRYPAGQISPENSGAQWRMALAGRTEYSFEFRVKFTGDFEWTQGGKLPGLMGGTAPAGGYYSADGFSSRFMWRPGGKLVVYLYWADQPSKNNPIGQQYGTDIPLDSPVYMTPETSYTIAQRVKLNTPGASDGVLQVWVNGVQKLYRTNLRFRLSGKSWTINRFYFTSFYGGATNDYRPTRDNFALFDDLKIWYPTPTASTSSVTG